MEKNIKKDENINEIEELKKQTEEAKTKCDEYLAGWKRERADFINYKKEEIEKIGQLIKYANEELILKILSILDNIYLAEKELPEEIKNNKWTEGFLQIKNQLEDFLAKEEIEQIKTVNEKFDPNFMEAIEETGGIPMSPEMSPETEKIEMVAEEVQRGYTLRGKIIRPAKVRIGK